MKFLPLSLATLLAATAPLNAAPAGPTLSLNVRLRYEDVQQTGLRDAEALTVRTRLGLSPAPFHGWTALLEGENIATPDGDCYSQAGLNPGGTGRAVVADPELTEINQAWLAYTYGGTTATLGRQRLVLDNARFVGDSGWRQDMQTFDAIVVQDKTLEKTVLTYAYLDRINRVFGDRHPQGYWHSDSHLLNASYAGLPGGTLTGYAYLLDFKPPAAANSCATYGASFAGKAKLSPELTLAYRLEAAHQTDYGSSQLNYSANYFLLETGLSAKPGGLTVGYEVLGSDHGTGFKTPLATLHAFNGWADLFLATPATGLRDTYVKLGAPLPGAVALVAVGHWYESATGATRLGTEFNLQLSRKFGPRCTGLLKYADFRRGNTTQPDVRKIWAQVEFAL